MDIVTKEQVYDAIRDWEIDAGESFIDYFEHNINPVSFMFWCLGKGYTTKEKMGMWHTDYIKHKLDAIDANYYISGYEVPYSIFPQTEGMTSDEHYALEDKGLHVLAEFISSTKTYLDRLDKFIKEYDEQ